MFDKLALEGKIVAYTGYDCTAPSLHVRQPAVDHDAALAAGLGCRQAHHAHGCGTTRVGDPSGKDETRAMRSLEEIDRNKQGIKQVFAKLLRFGDGKTDAVMVDNADWLAPLNYIEFLRDVGRHFSVNRMLTMDSARLRLEREQELSFIEFNYMLLQAYDYVELARRLGTNLQMAAPTSGATSSPASTSAAAWA